MNHILGLGLVIAVAALSVAACASHENGYGAALGHREDAELRQQVADATVAPDSREFYLSLIEKMQRQGLYFASLAHIDAFEAKFGTSPDIRLLRADALAKTEQPSQARAVYETLVDTNVAGPAWHGIGLIDAGRGAWSSALPALQKAVERDPTNPAFVSDLGFAYMKSGDLIHARVPIAQAAELAPNDLRIVGNLALFLTVNGDNASAIAVMNKAMFPLAARDAVRSMAVQIKRDMAKSSLSTVPGAATNPTKGTHSMRSSSVPATEATASVSTLAAKNDLNVSPVLTQHSLVVATPDIGSSLKATEQDAGPSAFSMQSMLDRFGHMN